jgi:hypothetical protein
LIRDAPGKKVTGVNEWLNFQDIYRLIARALGKDIQFLNTAPDFSQGDPEMVQSRVEMMGFCYEFGYDGINVDKTVVRSNYLGEPVKLEPVKEWINKQDWVNLLPTG